MLLPYLDSEVNKQVFLNGEKARTWDAYHDYLPGMFASVTGTAYSDSDPLGYFSNCGIQELA